MTKISLFVVLISASLFAQNFEQFLNNAIKNSPYLKASNLGIEQAKERGSTLTRYANPTLELELSNFTPDVGSSDTGYRATYSQPIRLWGIANDKDKLSLTMIESASSLNKLNRAKFIKNISLAFTSYANQKQLLKLGLQELNIADNIYNISIQRKNAGTISKGDLLQAKVGYEMVKIRIETLKLSTLESYYKVLNLAGFSKEIEINTDYEFIISQEINILKNPTIKYLKANQKKSLALSDVNSHSIEWLSLVAEYEAEPDQSILRVGASLPLAFFNTKSQEKQISKLQAKKSELQTQNKNNQLKLEILRLKKQRKLLLELKQQNETTLKNQMDLLKMFKDGYKIASVNLLQLQSIKNNVIETKENIIKLKTALNQNAINTNYITGAYND